MRKASSAKTRRILNYILHPRPTPVYPRLGTHSRYRQAYRKSVLSNYERLPNDRRSNADLAAAITQSLVAHLPLPGSPARRPQRDFVYEREGAEHERAPESPVGTERRLRSYRTMKHRTIREQTIALEMRRRSCINAFAEAATGRSLRRMPRITRDHAYFLDAPPYANGCPDDVLIPTQEASTNSSHDSSESTFYFTARSAFSEPSEEHAQQTILQILDAESGVIFDKVCQGSKGTLKGRPFAPGVLDGQYAVAVQPQSPRLRRNLASDNLVGMAAQPIPSLVLTLPTPQLPASPVFLQRSPITVHQFIAAAEAPSAPLPPDGHPLRPVPSMEFCPDCVLVHPDSSLLCHSCDQQWLACKVWYQANDGGRRQRLTEPYIKPAESNATNRALMDLLQAPTGSGSSYGLGIRAGPQVVVSKSRFRKLAPLLAMATAESSMSIIYREEVLPVARRALSAVNLRALAILPRKLWAILVDVLAHNIRLLGPFLHALAELNLHVGLGCDTPDYSECLWMMTEESANNVQLVARATQTTSRFLEHLGD